MSPNESVRLTWDDLPGLFPEFPAPERWLTILERHLRLVHEAAPHTRVTSVAPADAVARHYAESLELLRLVLERAPVPGTAIDVGSGGGYPGMVIAAVLPTTSVVLVESLQKRARLLAAAATELGLANVTVHAVRAEEAGRTALRDGAALVTARAVAQLGTLVEYTAPLTAPGGLIALPKGSGLDDELAEARPACAALDCEVLEVAPMRPVISSTARVVFVGKRGPTPSAYPRRPGAATKRPIKG